MPVNWGGAAGGAASGATVGSLAGPWGTLAGGILGGLGGLFSGSKDKFKQINNLNPEQQKYLSGLFSQLQGMGGQGGAYSQAQQYNQGLLSGDPAAYERFAAPYKTQFEQQTLPMLAEKFAGMGGGLGGGALGSSGFGQAIGGAATQFQSNLAGLYANLQQAAADRAFGQYNTLAGLGLGTRAFENAYQPGNLGFGGASAAGLAQGIGQGVGQGTGMGISERIANMFKPKTGKATGTENFNDTFGPNAGMGTYNPYTGYQG